MIKVLYCRCFRFLENCKSKNIEFIFELIFNLVFFCVLIYLILNLKYIMYVIKFIIDLFLLGLRMLKLREYMKVF